MRFESACTIHIFAFSYNLLLYCTVFLSGIATAASRGTNAMGRQTWRALGWSKFADYRREEQLHILWGLRKKHNHAYLFSISIHGVNAKRVP